MKLFKIIAIRFTALMLFPIWLILAIMVNVSLAFLNTIDWLYQAVVKGSLDNEFDKTIEI